MNIEPRHETLYTLGDVYRASPRVLESILRNHPAPPLTDLVGWEFNGANVGFAPGLIGIRKFRKGFYDGPARASGPEPFIQGYNVPIRQDGIARPWRAKPSDAHPKRFGFYRVFAANESTRHRRYPQALLLDYGLGANGPLSVPGLLRDYLVQLHPGSSDLLLGASSFALPTGDVPSGLLVIERAHRHSFKG